MFIMREDSTLNFGKALCFCCRDDQWHILGLRFTVVEYISRFHAYNICEISPAQYIMIEIENLADIEPLDCIVLQSKKYVCPKWHVLGLAAYELL